ncbi:MAG: hypothetical protein AABY32_01745 [Nanoarchaeota archaeon]
MNYQEMSKEDWLKSKIYISCIKSDLSYSETNKTYSIENHYWGQFTIYPNNDFLVDIMELFTDDYENGEDFLYGGAVYKIKEGRKFIDFIINFKKYVPAESYCNKNIYKRTLNFVNKMKKYIHIWEESIYWASNSLLISYKIESIKTEKE